MATDKSWILSMVTRVNNFAEEVPQRLKCRVKKSNEQYDWVCCFSDRNIQQHNLTVTEPIEQNDQNALLIILT